MKLRDLKFTDIQGRINRLPTTTDASRAITSELDFAIWKQEFSRFHESNIRFVDRGVIWGGMALIVDDMESHRNRYITLKSGALS